MTTTCETCGLTYYYDPKHHRCDGIIPDAPPIVDPYAGMSWAEECLAKVREENP